MEAFEGLKNECCDLVCDFKDYSGYIVEICGKKFGNCGKFVERGIEKTKIGCLIVVQAKGDNVLD